MSEYVHKAKESTECLFDIIDELERALMRDVESDADGLNIDELEKASNAIHYLTEAAEKKIKSMYHMQIMEAMDKAEYGKDYDKDGMIK